MTDADKQAAAEQKEAFFNVEKLYVKDMSLEVPHAPQIFLTQEAPEIEMNLSHESEKIEDEFYNVALTVTCTAKLPDGKVMFLNEVTQCGIFRIANIPEEDMKVLLAIACPNILYPYLREVVSTTTTRAGFPPVILSPINFEAMYQQTQMEPQGNA